MHIDVERWQCIIFTIERGSKKSIDPPAINALVTDTLGRREGQRFFGNRIQARETVPEYTLRPITFVSQFPEPGIGRAPVIRVDSGKAPAVWRRRKTWLVPLHHKIPLEQGDRAIVAVEHT